jgi:GPH family glycoside/pentoside/hexuronide:cation symporter
LKQKTYGQLRFTEILAFNAGYAVEIITTSTVSLLAIPIYSIALGVSPALMGIAFLVPRLLDAIIEPLMGYISDNTRSRWGRRRPYLIAGGILTGISYALMWMPPTMLGHTGLFIYFLAISLFFYGALTVYMVPYYAFSNEVTYDPKTRVRLMAWRNLVWGGITLLAPWSYHLCFSSFFGNNEVQGARFVGALFGTLTAAMAVLPALFCKENMAVQKQPSIRFFLSLKEAIKNRYFLILVVVRTCSLFGFVLIAPMVIYVATYYVYNNNSAAAARLFGFIGMSWGVGAILSAPIVDWMTKRIGTKPTLFISLLLMGFGQMMWWPCLIPSNPYLAILPFLIVAPGITGMSAVTSIWLADICDYDEYHSYTRREGMLSSVFSLILKGVTAGAAGVSGLLLSLSGIDSRPGAAQTAEAIWNIRMQNAVVPLIFVIIALIFGLLYPLTERRMKEVKSELAQRKAHIG